MVLFEGRANEMAVMDIGPKNDDSQRNSSLVNMQMNLRPRPSPVGWVCPNPFVFGVFLSGLELESESRPWTAIQVQVRHWCDTLPSRLRIFDQKRPSSPSGDSVHEWRSLSHNMLESCSTDNRFSGEKGCRS